MKIAIIILLISNIVQWIYIRKCPKVKINDKNEAVITLADGKTEIYNYDLKKKQ